jgi:FkbH-like protein
MIETLDYDVSHSIDLPEQALQRFRELGDAIDARSQIVWGEHCSECGFPHCYSTCAFFTPRKDDLNCGRFVKGIEQAKIGKLRLSRIEFRKWGKLWGKGPVGLVSGDAAERRERTSDFVSRGIVRWVPHPFLRRAEWEANNWKRRNSAQNQSRPDVFVVEAWLPDRYSRADFTLTLVPGGDTRTGLFQTKLELGPGYNRRLVPVDQIEARVDLSAPYEIQLEPLEGSIGIEITFGLTEFVTLNRRIEEVIPARRSSSLREAGTAHPVPKVKCVVWDLDNTIWRGTLAEDGVEGLTLDLRAKSLIEELDRRGILQSIASKNDPEPALEALQAFGIREYFLYPQISWSPKSGGVERIAGLLDIGLDTFAFVDDQAFERGEVGEKLPQVAVFSETDLPKLLEDARFDVPITPESAARRSMYQAEEKRKAHFEVAAGDYVGFLRECDIVLDAFPLSPENTERAHELSQRTNQLNVSGRRYSRGELMAMQAPTATFLFSCRDRFGDYGTIAMCVLNRDNAEIESFMMSCRVQRKRVEQAIFSWLARQCRARGFAALTVQYRKTKRNDASVRMLQELGFEFRPASDAESGTFVLPTSVPISEDDVVAFRDRTQWDPHSNAAKTA